MTSNADTIGARLYSYLTGKGFSPAQAQLAEAGFLGNFKIESGFDPTSYNSGEGAQGIAQWEGGRGDSGALGTYAANHGGSVTNLSTQIGFLEHELDTSYTNTVTQLRSVSSPQQAAYVVASTFEGNTPDSDPARESAAASIYSQIKAGTSISGSSNTGAGGGRAGGLGASVGGVGPDAFKIPNPFNPLDNLKFALPGGELLTIPGVSDLTGGVASSVAGSVAGDVEKGALSVLTAVAHPLYTFVVNAGLVVFGLIAIIIALVLFAHVDEDAAAAAANGRESNDDSESGTEGAAGGEEAAAAA